MGTPSRSVSSQHAAVTGDQLPPAINQDWNIAPGDLPDLFLAAKPRILRVKPKRS